MKKKLFIFTLLFLCINIRVMGFEVKNDDYLNEIKKDVIIVGIQNKDESLQDFKKSYFAKYLKEKLKLNVKLKIINEKNGKDELLSKEIDFLENTSVEDNPNIKYLNYNLLNNIIIVCRDNYDYNLTQLAYKKVGIVDRNNIKNYPIADLNKNNNVKLYKNFSELAKALENNEIDLGIVDKESRFEVLLYKNLNVCEDKEKWKWKEGIATANSKYYKLMDIINNNIYKKPNLINDFLDSNEDYNKVIKEAFYKSLSNEEKQYINKTNFVNVVIQNNSFPILYEENNQYNGILNYLMESFNKLTNIKIKYIDNEDNKLINKNNMIKENISYEKNDKISNVICRTNLIIISLNKNISDFKNFDRVDRNSLGILKQIKLNDNNGLLKQDVAYFENLDKAIKAMKNKEINFVLTNKDLFDYYQLQTNDKNIIQIKDLDIPSVYYLSSDNEILSSILTKVYKIHSMETDMNKSKSWIVKDYMRNSYIKTICKNKEFYKFLTMFAMSILVILIIFIVVNKRNKDKKNDVIKKLDTILKGDSNLDIIEIDLKNQKVICKNGLIFSNNKTISLSEYLKIINLKIEDYLNKYKSNTLEYCNEVLINEEKRYFKQYVYSINNKKIISIITDITEQAKEKIYLEEKIRIDSLTGLINRDYYNKEIQKLINKKPKSKGAFLFIDINDFKKFNDEFGHDFGDKVIKVIADKLKSTQDLNTIPFRIAGDEFGVYKHQVKNEDEVIWFLKDVAHKLTIKEHYNELIINVNCSIGCAMDCININDIGILKNHAEAEMYKCKKKKDSKSNYKLYKSN